MFPKTFDSSNCPKCSSVENYLFGLITKSPAFELKEFRTLNLKLMSFVEQAEKISLGYHVFDKYH